MSKVKELPKPRNTLSLLENIYNMRLFYKKKKRHVEELIIYFVKLTHSQGTVSLLIRYCISGLAVGIFYVLIGYLFLNWFGLSMPIAVTLSYIVTTPVAFTLQKRFTFKSDCALSRELPRFITVGVLLLASSTAAHKFIVLPIPLLAQLFAFWLFSSILNFLAYKFWVFTHEK